MPRASVTADSPITMKSATVRMGCPLVGSGWRLPKNAFSRMIDVMPAVASLVARATRTRGSCSFHAGMRTTTRFVGSGGSIRRTEPWPARCGSWVTGLENAPWVTTRSPRSSVVSHWIGRGATGSRARSGGWRSLSSPHPSVKNRTSWGPHLRIPTARVSMGCFMVPPSACLRLRCTSSASRCREPRGPCLRTPVRSRLPHRAPAGQVLPSSRHRGPRLHDHRSACR